MIRMVVPALALLALTGCNKTVWVRPGSTAADFENDKMQCQYQAELATAGIGLGGGYQPSMSAAVGSGVGAGIVAAMQQADLTRKCMVVKGWTPQRKEEAESQSQPQTQTITVPK